MMELVRAVLDANVIASGVVGYLRSTSTPSELLRRWIAGSYDVFLSNAILAEVDRTLEKPYFVERATASLRADVITAARKLAIIVDLTTAVEDVASHPEDDLVLATALNAGANFLVTGDKVLLELGTFQGIVILTPRAFLDLLNDMKAAPAGEMSAP